MIVKLLVNTVTPGSYEKAGVKIPTLDLICFDQGEGSRVGHALTVSVDRSQKEQLLNADLRDKTIHLDVHEVRTNFRGAVQFGGIITNAADLVGPLKVVKSEGKQS